MAAKLVRAVVKACFIKSRLSEVALIFKISHYLMK